jgi:branched-chain amino acid transport system substrate-binding protein
MRAGAADYVALVNKKGGVEGHPIELVDIEMGYDVARGVEAYERMKQAGVVALYTAGTPAAVAIQDRCQADKIVCVAYVAGVVQWSQGERFPYMFIGGPSYWSETAAAVDFALKQSRGTGRPKIAYLYSDNPAGREPLDLIRELARREGFELREFAIPLTAVDVTPQVADIVQRYQADWVIAHVFARHPVLVWKAFRDLGYPLDRVLCLHWCVDEDIIRGAGGWQAMEGARFMGVHLTGTDLPVMRDIVEMYRAEGKSPPEYMTAANTFYTRGLLVTAFMIEGIRNALKQEGEPVTGEKVRRGLEAITGDLAGLGLVKVQMGPNDHEGGGLVRIMRVKGGKFVPETDWYNAYRDVIAELLRTR